LDSSKPLIENQLKHLLLILISFLLLSSPVIGQSERPETIIVPVSSIGDVSDTRKQILENTLTNELKQYFRIVPQEKYQQVLEQVFQELEFEECSEDTCIMRVQELLQVENVFNLQIISEGNDSQLNLKWITLNEKKNEEDYCEGCGTRDLRKMIVVLVEKLVGEKIVEPVVPIISNDSELKKKQAEEINKEEVNRKKRVARKLERKIDKEKKIAKQLEEEDEKWDIKQSEIWEKNDYTSYSFNLFSPLGYPDNQNVRGFRFNFIYGDHENVRGWDLGYFGVNRSKTLHGLQSSFVGLNIVTEEMRGLQLNVMGINYAKKGGSQLGGITINVAEEATYQVSLVNLSKSSEFQLGALNVGKDDGVYQVGFLGNYAGKAKFQLGFLANYATSEANQMSLFGGYAGTTKFQLGIINIVETLEGTQIGLINIAKYSKGCQFGLINLTIKKESGFPLLPIVNCSM
jgi:hypothetical protein